jgi:hypothetical protein
MTSGLLTMLKILSSERSPLPVTDVDVPSESNCRAEVAIVPLSDVAYVTKTTLKVGNFPLDIIQHVRRTRPLTNTYLQINVDSLMNSSDELETIKTTKELLAFASDSKRCKYNCERASVLSFIN